MTLLMSIPVYCDSPVLKVAPPYMFKHDTYQNGKNMIRVTMKTKANTTKMPLQNLSHFA